MLRIYILIDKLPKMYKCGGGSIDVRITKSKQREFKTFHIITKLAIIVMLVYIVMKLFSLIFVGSTRQILIIETKQWIAKSIKNMICNEILQSDKYLTEDKIISIASMQKRNKEISDVDKTIQLVYNKINQCEEVLINEVKEFAKKTMNSDLNSSSNNANNKNKDIIYEKVKQENLKSVEKYLINYKASNNDISNNRKIINGLKNNKDTNYLVNKFFAVDGSTSVDRNIFKTQTLMNISNKLRGTNNRKPQILIYHTHGSEKYSDSTKKRSDSVIGVGDYLTYILEEYYGYNVVHEDKIFDVVNNNWNRNAYDTALPVISSILKKNPTIEVVIDLHRDSGNKKVISKIGDINVAKIMFFNGVCRSNVGARNEIPNKNLKYNIAFSLDMQMKGMELYPGFTKKIFLKGYRYNMHLAKKYTLVEVGNNKNTVLEAKYAMIPFAKILNKVLTTY